MGDFDETVEARRAERRNQLRPIEVRDPQSHPQDSAGVEIEIMQSATTGTTLDMSRREAEDLLVKLARYLYAEQRSVPDPEPGWYLSTRHVGPAGSEIEGRVIPAHYLGKWPDAVAQERLIISTTWTDITPEDAP